MTPEDKLNSPAVAAVEAGSLGDASARHDHFAEVARHASAIRAAREKGSAASAAGTSAPPNDPATPLTGTPTATPSAAPVVIYGARPARLENWEDEGGALRPPAPPPPASPRR